MANSLLNVDNSLPWLRAYDPDACNKLQGSISRTSDTLDYLISDLFSAIASWKNSNSNQDLQSSLLSIFQGGVLNVDFPKCIDLYSCNDIFITFRNLSDTHYWQDEAPPIDPQNPVTPTPTNADLVALAVRARDNDLQQGKLDSLVDSIHHASTSRVFMGAYSPKSFINSNGEPTQIPQSPLDLILETKGYIKLFDLYTDLPRPDYK